MTISSSSSNASAASAGRSSGRFSSMCSIQAASFGSRLGLTVRGGGGAAFTCRNIRTIGFSASWNGVLPVSIS